MAWVNPAQCACKLKVVCFIVGVDSSVTAALCCSSLVQLNWNKFSFSYLLLGRPCMLGSGQRYQILSHCARVKNPLPCENHKCFRRAVVCFQTRAILAWSCVFWLAQCAKRVIPIMYLMPLPTACQGFIAAAISCLHQHFPFFPPQFPFSTACFHWLRLAYQVF